MYHGVCPNCAGGDTYFSGELLTEDEREAEEWVEDHRTMGHEARYSRLD